MRKAYTKIIIKLSIFAFICSGLLPGLIQAKTYRWVDKNGKVHYSQTVPPSASQLGHDEIDEKNGMKLGEVESSEARVRRKKEKELQGEKDRQKKKMLREELMIYMFSSKKELVGHFEHRLSTISTNIRLLQYHRKKLKNTVEEVGNHLKNAKNPKLKAKLETGLQEAQRALIDHTRAIETNEKERKEVTEQMQRAVKLYEKKYGSNQLNVGSLIGSSVLDELRSQKNASLPQEEMCTCPCSALKKQPAPKRLFE